MSVCRGILARLLQIASVAGAQTHHDEASLMNKQIVLDFVRAINEHHVDNICALMTDDHRFIDSHGNETVGKDKMKSAWLGYLNWFPDYKIEITQMFIDGDTVAAFGFAGGSLQGSGKKEDTWRLPAAWRAIVQNGKVALWQVYADAKIPFDILSKLKK